MQCQLLAGSESKTLGLFSEILAFMSREYWGVERVFRCAFDAVVLSSEDHSPAPLSAFEVQT
jgi:hypothetical protein